MLQSAAGVAAAAKCRALHAAAGVAAAPRRPRLRRPRAAAAAAGGGAGMGANAAAAMAAGSAAAAAAAAPCVEQQQGRAAGMPPSCLGGGAVMAGVWGAFGAWQPQSGAAAALQTQGAHPAASAYSRPWSDAAPDSHRYSPPADSAAPLFGRPSSEGSPGSGGLRGAAAGAVVADAFVAAAAAAGTAAYAAGQQSAGGRASSGAGGPPVQRGAAAAGAAAGATYSRLARQQQPASQHTPAAAPAAAPPPFPAPSIRPAGPAKLTPTKRASRPGAVAAGGGGAGGGGAHAAALLPARLRLKPVRRQAAPKDALPGGLAATAADGEPQPHGGAALAAVALLQAASELEQLLHAAAAAAAPAAAGGGCMPAAAAVWLRPIKQLGCGAFGSVRLVALEGGGGGGGGGPPLLVLKTLKTRDNIFAVDAWAMAEDEFELAARASAGHACPTDGGAGLACPACDLGSRAVRPFALGRVYKAGGGGAAAPGILMEVCPLGDLYDWFEAGDGALTPEELGRELLVAMHHANDHAGVTHRDLKPENILVWCHEPLRLKIGDFGLASSKSVAHTRGIGTPGYQAPEQLGGAAAAAGGGDGGTACRADLFSVGATLLNFATKTSAARAVAAAAPARYPRGAELQARLVDRELPHALDDAGLPFGPALAALDPTGCAAEFLRAALQGPKARPSAGQVLAWAAPPPSAGAPAWARWLAPAPWAGVAAAAPGSVHESGRA
ncbi:MAG: kinase-like domain-containing protein [Monoraphidium minutum]|nr:MAG: kinase-like domain-containing protein [Monoraphidium minutum]